VEERASVVIWWRGLCVDQRDGGLRKNAPAEGWRIRSLAYCAIVDELGGRIRADEVR